MAVLESEELLIAVSGSRVRVSSRVWVKVSGLAVDTILLCFCEDVRDGTPYFMSKALRKFFKAQRSSKKKKKVGDGKAGEI